MISSINSKRKQRMVVCPRAIVPLAGASETVLDSVLKLNQLNTTELSELDLVRLNRLIAEAFHAVTIDDGAAFLLAFDQDAEYESPNFQWFRSRYPRFIYVDRVAVATSARGQGLASQLYWSLFEVAAVAGHSIIACEINLDPPNPASDSFHDVQGFAEVGRAQLSSGKIVRYLVKASSPMTGRHGADASHSA